MAKQSNLNALSIARHPSNETRQDEINPRVNRPTRVHSRSYLGNFSLEDETPVIKANYWSHT